MSYSYQLADIADVADDATLIAIFQGAVAAITGLDPTLVRPRWQPQPPTQPSASTNWAALGITTYESTDYAFWQQDSDTDGSTHRLERIDILVSFYGPLSGAYARALRDGFYLVSNFQTLSHQGIKLREAGQIVHLAEEVNTQEIQRSDLSCNFLRMVERQYTGDDFQIIGSIEVDISTPIANTGSVETVTVVFEE